MKDLFKPKRHILKEGTVINARMQFAAVWAFWHFVASVAVVCTAGVVVFGWWYESPWRQLLGVGTIFGLLVAVDIVVGPMLTAVLANPLKSRRERWIDLCLVACLQLAALTFGMWSVHAARPVILAFEVDRLVVITANEVQVEQLPDALPQFRELSVAGPKIVSLRKAESPEEYLQSLEHSLQGVTQAMRPGWWRPVDEAVPELLKRAKPFQSLIERRPADRDALVQAAERSGHAISNLKYLPLTSTRTHDWVVLISTAGNVVGYSNVDGFE